MKRAKVKQFIVCILTMLSLSASSVAACACSHHGKKKEAEAPSCHKHAEQKSAEQKEDPSFESVNSEIECTCFANASSIFTKSSNIKFEKLFLAALAKTNVEIEFVSQTALATHAFSKPLYLSDSFYNLAPGRAPPVL